MNSGRSKFKKSKLPILILIKIFKFLPISISSIIIFPFLGWTGNIGFLFRYMHASLLFGKLGEAAYLAKGVVFKSPAKLFIGDNFSIHEFCYVDAVGGVEIGTNVSLAHSSSILSSNHQWLDENLPIKYNNVKKKKVLIEDDVWIGCGVRILAGSHIENRVVVAAGAVVTGRLESGYLYGGIPAKKIKSL